MTRPKIALLGLVLAPLLFVAATALVTAAVTPDPVSAAYSVVVVNNKTGQTGRYTKKDFKDQDACEAAIAGLSMRLASYAALDPNAPVLVEAPDADPDLAESVDNLMIQVIMNTGVVPDFSIACVVFTDPA